jgi:hypothetical protein
LILSWVFAGLHQGWVWFFWRMELHRGRIRAWFGERGFLLLRVGFVLFASSRTVVLLVLYHPGLLLHSRLGLIAAAANHVLVWTHYFCTERPDMREIYGPRAAG